MKDKLRKIGSSIKIIDNILQIIIQSRNISLDIFEFLAISGSSAVTLKVLTFFVESHPFNFEPTRDFLVCVLF